ncbi:MAG: PaaI family thioesterase [Sneathiella sp.]|nr:PaaI family thioesterase [Sneathiella sp.]
MSYHPFADHIGLHVSDAGENESLCTLVAKDELYNPHKVIHGGVLYSMADTGMGAALYPTLQEGEICATVEIKINYFKPVFGGEITCRTVIVNRGKTLANLESEIWSDDILVAKANGSYAIYPLPKIIP